MIDVEYLRHCGDDLAIVNAAKVSFDAESEWDMVPVNPKFKVFAKSLSDKDVGLLHFLARNKHKSPFNHAFASFRVKMPIFVARQLVKHEYLPWNEVSRRYVEGDLEFYFPDLDDYRSQPANVKQGSGDALEGPYALQVHNRFAQVCKFAEEAYEEAIELGLSREQARMILPQSLMTTVVWSGSIYAFAKMCQLRLDDHAQAESRYVAEKIDATLKELFPHAWGALMEHGAT